MGQALQDHTAAFLGPFLMNKPKTTLLDRDLTPGKFVQCTPITYLAVAPSNRKFYHLQGLVLDQASFHRLERMPPE